MTMSQCLDTILKQNLNISGELLFHLNYNYIIQNFHLFPRIYSSQKQKTPLDKTILGTFFRTTYIKVQKINCEIYKKAKLILSSQKSLLPKNRKKVIFINTKYCICSLINYYSSYVLK